MDGKEGQLSDKSRGACCMVAGYVCAIVGLWRNIIVLSDIYNTHGKKLVRLGLNTAAALRLL